MDNSPSIPGDSPEASRSKQEGNAGNAGNALHLYPTLSRESTSSIQTVTPKTDSWPSKFTSQNSNSAPSAPTSTAPSPLPSRETSPTRPLSRTANSRASSANPGTRSRKNSLHETSPQRATRPNNSGTSSTSTSRILSSTNTPTLLPAISDPNINAPVPIKSPTALDHLKESPRWPVSPRLRSPPPILNKPNLGPPRRGEPDAPLISIQRATPPQPLYPDTQSDTDTEDARLQSGARTPARGAGGSASTLETVQEVSPLNSPRVLDDSMEEKLGDSITSETSHPDIADVSDIKGPASKANMNESGSETGSIKASRRTAGSSIAPPLTTRQSSTSVKPGAGKGKAGETSLQTMTVETEIVTSIPQVAVAPGGGVQGSNGSLRTKPSNETIRPKKEKKKGPRKQPSVTTGTGEPPTSTVLLHSLRHRQSLRSYSFNEMRTSPTKYFGQFDDVPSTRWPRSPSSRSPSTSTYQMSTLLTRTRPASSKADIFEAKVASAVEEANSSDSEETFVYDSNPPETRERPQRFHSRTPSATSMASQVDRTGMRSIHTVMENAIPPITVKRSMKFVNSHNANEAPVGVEDDGRGTGRSNASSTRGTARHHHHFGRWGRNGGGNGHPSLFAEHSPFGVSGAPGNNTTRQSSAPPSPRYAGRGIAANGKRGIHLSAGYDADDTTTDPHEGTPLLPTSTIRSSRSGRMRRGDRSLRSVEAQTYRTQGSVLNRFASCLVLTVMLLLVVSSAIGFMFATSQPLDGVALLSIDHVVASQQELMFDLTIRAHNPNAVVVVVDAADLEIFAKSPHAGTDSEWWRHTHPGEIEPVREGKARDKGISPVNDPQDGDSPPEGSPKNMRLGTITGFNNALSFEGSFFVKGYSYSTGEVRLKSPGNGTYGGPERWERILDDEFQLIVDGVLKYTLPLSQRIRTAKIIKKITVKPNAANDPVIHPNTTSDGISIS